MVMLIVQGVDNGMEMTKNEENNWGMFCHLSVLSGFILPFGNILGPLIIWLMKKDESTFVNDQGKEALNFQISVFIYIIGAVLLLLLLFAIAIFLPVIGFLFLILGILLIIGIGIAETVFVIIAGVKANRGEAYRYPLTIRFIK